MSVLFVFVCVFGVVLSADVTYFSDWSMMGGRPVQPTCMDIPKNMTLCHDIGYTKMRLPNLLDHDTMAEVCQQAASWVPLLNIKCHPDTQLFLCSLFSPVCLDRPIYPCRSLCDQVRSGCEGRMRVYGFPWPEILKCEKFPLDNDMCITAQAANSQQNEGGGACQACNQVETYENILDNFCRADFAVKTKVKKVKKSKVVCKKGKVYKTSSLDKKELRLVRRPTFVLDTLQECCARLGLGRESKDNYLVMGVRRGPDLVPTFVMPWHARSKAFRSAVRMFKKLDCSDPKIVSESMIADGLQSRASNKSVRRATSGGTLSASTAQNGQNRRRKGRKNGSNSTVELEPEVTTLTTVGEDS